STVRVKLGGGLGGHNGLKDLARHMGKDFSRVRVGVGRPPEGWKAADYVLSQWTTEEKTSVDTVVDQACDAVETVLSDGPDAAMNRFNARVRESTGSNPDTDSQNKR
ncbi:MAG: aminoacyl-tRNA hydrolase, partial [Myxococcota bacterium]|nr:aminoacyl-tRNA hydrolase [Myxococcota bacterium]